MMDWRPLETSQVEKRSPMRVNNATPCVLCPVRTCPHMPPVSYYNLKQRNRHFFFKDSSVEPEDALQEG